MDDDTRSDTVKFKFNVGGKRFETSRDLINQQPGSMLSRMISDTWHKQTSDSDTDDKPIFIDRSGDIFQHVLEYLRYGSVLLPTSIPTEMFIRDLEYYLLEYDASTITDGEERFAVLKKKNDKLNEEHAALKKNYAKLKKNHDHLDRELNSMIALKLITDANQRLREVSQMMRQARQGGS